jgi:hypothetical protein
MNGTRKVQTGHDQPRLPGRHAEDIAGQRGYGVGLHHVPDTEGRDRGSHTEEHAQPLLFQSALEHVHGAAQHGAVRRAHPVLDRQQRLGIFCGNAEHARKPHPEHRPGPAQGDGGCNANDIASADGGGQGSGESAELADVAFGRVVPGYGQSQGGWQIALDEPQAEGQEQMRPEEQNQQRRPPQP